MSPILIRFYTSVLPLYKCINPPNKLSSTVISVARLIFFFFFLQKSDGPMLFIYRKGHILAEQDMKNFQSRDISYILGEPKKPFDHLHQKRIYGQALYLVFQEGRYYDTLLDACVLKLNYLIKKCTQSKALLKQMSEQSVALCAQLSMSQVMAQFDLEQLAKYGGEKSENNYESKWNLQLQEMKSKIEKLKTATSKVITRYESAFSRAIQLNTKYGDAFSKEKSNDLISW